MKKQDHRTYSRAQLDRAMLNAGRIATREAVQFYNLTLIMAMQGEGIQVEKIKDILLSSESIFESIKCNALSFKDCAEDVLQNTGIDVFAN
ncbi:MAG: hypothetical protein N2376_02405 [Clostridia bacterium]|nr:hypothetical protein [Clostridia bacterium]